VDSFTCFVYLFPLSDGLIEQCVACLLTVFQFSWVPNALVAHADTFDSASLSQIKDELNSKLPFARITSASTDTVVHWMQPHVECVLSSWCEKNAGKLWPTEILALTFLFNSCLWNVQGEAVCPLRKHFDLWPNNLASSPLDYFGVKQARENGVPVICFLFVCR
jgi:hypothetical protein